MKNPTASLKRTILLSLAEREFMQARVMVRTLGHGAMENSLQVDMLLVVRHVGQRNRDTVAR